MQTFTILSQQNKRGTETFKLHNTGIYKRFTITVVSDFKKSYFEINAALETLKIFKIDAVAFNGINTIYKFPVQDGFPSVILIRLIYGLGRGMSNDLFRPKLMSQLLSI